jgi:phage terminase large subunit-like protein
MLIQNKTIWTPDNSFLLEYKERTETGEILIGQELWQELENLCDDFHDDRYFYDTSAANLRMDFMENCVRLTKDPFYNQPMKLMLWQKAWIETLYSFKMAEQSAEKGIMIDRFKKTMLLISRKNTKSETSSALGLSELIVGNDGSDIVCSSNDDIQASILYDAIDLMRMLIDPYNMDTKRNQRFILNKANNSKVFKLSDKTRNKEGRNISFAVLDEVHEMLTNTILKSIEQSQSLKLNPKLILITTEGFVVDGALDDELKKCRAIISGEDDGISAERYLPWLYTQDSEQEIYQNRNSWVKSNPSLGVVKQWSYLDEQVDLARTSKADRIFVLSKDFNIKQNGAESWLNLEDYDYKAVYDLEDFRGFACLGAVDLSQTTDLCCAKVLLMKPNDPTKYIHTMYFIPEGKLESSDDKNAGAEYESWAKENILTVTEGHDIDLYRVADWFYSLYKEYDIKLWKAGYDQKFSKEWIKGMERYNWYKTGDEDSDLIMILQNANTLSNAMKLLEADLRHQLVNYNENKMDKWCFKNSLMQVDKCGQCLCVKKEQAKRIDGAVTNIILYEMYRRYRTEFKQMIGGN